MSEQQERSHPAAEIVAISLRKIVKLSNNKKHPQLHDEIKLFLDNIQQLIPAVPSPPEASSLGSALASNPSLQAALKETPDDAAMVPPSHGRSISMVPPAESTSSSSLNLQLRVSSLAKAHFEADDIAAAAVEFTQDGAAAEASPAATPPDAPPSPPAPPAGGATGEGSQGPPNPPPQPFHHHHHSQSSSGVLSSGISALDAVSAGATAALMTDIVPRTETALPDEVLSRVLAVLRLAVESDRPNIIEVALDCIQKLIAFKFLQGAAYAIDLEKQTGMEAGVRSWPAGAVRELR